MLNVFQGDELSGYACMDKRRWRSITSGLVSGNYDREIQVNSNIPTLPLIRIPVCLEALESLVVYSTNTTGDYENNQLSGQPDHDINVYLSKDDPILPV